MGHSFLVFADVCISRQINTAIKKANRKTHKLFEKALRLDASTRVDGDAGIPLIENLQSTPADDPEAIVQAADEIERAREFLMRTLTQMEAEVLGLHSQGKTFEEMAAALQLSVKGVDNAMQRVRRKLKGFLAGDQKDDPGQG